MIDKFVKDLNKCNKCIECVENDGGSDTEYNTFIIGSLDGVWKNGTGLKLIFNDGNTEIYLDNWEQFNMFDEVDDDDGTIYEFIFGNIKRKFIILPNFFQK